MLLLASLAVGPVVPMILAQKREGQFTESTVAPSIEG